MNTAVLFFIVIGAIGVGTILLLAARRVGNRTSTPPLTTSEADLTGAVGVVITAIPGGEYGAILVRVHGIDRRCAARASVPIAVGTYVYIVGALSDSAVEVVASDTVHR